MGLSFVPAMATTPLMVMLTLGATVMTTPGFTVTATLEGIGGGGLSDPLIPVGVRVMLLSELLKGCFYVLVLHCTRYSTCSIVLHCIAGHTRVSVLVC